MSRARYRLLHLSDLHLPRRDVGDADGIDAREALAQLLGDCRHVGQLDVVVVSGDIADDGSREGYADALTMVARFARERGAGTVWCTGNHDEREAFASVLGSGHLDHHGRDVGRLGLLAQGERAAVSHIGDLRLVTLDSLVPGQVHGFLDSAQLAWLRQVLADPSPAGSVVVLHHPPISVSDPWARASLLNPNALASALAGSDVRAVLCGHVHAQVAGRLGVIPVWVGPGVVTRIDLTAPTGVVRAVRGASATMVELGGPTSPMFFVLHARDPQAGAEAYLASGTSWEYLTSEEDELTPR